MLRVAYNRTAVLTRWGHQVDDGPRHVLSQVVQSLDQIVLMKFRCHRKVFHVAHMGTEVVGADHNCHHLHRYPQLYNPYIKLFVYE